MRAFSLLYSFYRPQLRPVFCPEKANSRRDLPPSRRECSFFFSHRQSLASRPSTPGNAERHFGILVSCSYPPLAPRAWQLASRVAFIQDSLLDFRSRPGPHCSCTTRVASMAARAASNLLFFRGFSSIFITLMARRLCSKSTHSCQKPLPRPEGVLLAMSSSSAPAQLRKTLFPAINHSKEHLCAFIL